MDILMFLVKLIVGAVLCSVALALLIILFELLPMLMAFTLGPMTPELAQVYTMLEIALIICILIFAFRRVANGLTNSGNNGPRRSTSLRPSCSHPELLLSAGCHSYTACIWLKGWAMIHPCVCYFIIQGARWKSKVPGGFVMFSKTSSSCPRPSW